MRRGTDVAIAGDGAGLMPLGFRRMFVNEETASSERRSRRGAAEEAATAPLTISELASSPVLGAMTREEIGRLCVWLDRAIYPTASTIVREGEATRDMYFVLEGEARIRRGETDLGVVGVGAHFGELALVTDRARSASVVSTSRLVVAQLTHARWSALKVADPGLALHLLSALIGALGGELADMTDRVGAILHERSLPRSTTVRVTIGGQARIVRTGVPVSSLLPAFQDEARVVAAVVDRKAVSLATAITADAVVEPLTAAHFEGERIVRRSATLLLLEAAADVAPTLAFQVGPSMGPAQWIDVTPAGTFVPAELARTIEGRMHALIAERRTFRQEWWTTEEAKVLFRDRGWNAVVDLLHVARESSVELVTCGRHYVLSMGALVSHAGLLGDEVRVMPSNSGLVLIAGAARDTFDVSELEAWAAAMRAHEKWLASLGVASVGAFDRACVDGGVAQTIRVAEGFHEKRLGMLADEIAAREGIRAVAVAGPSSSGKTTFLARLGVQLQVDGLRPVGLSLDDYYRDHAAITPGPDGQRDYEAFEALDVPLLRDHLASLLAGATVTTARYDFKTGRSEPEGGPTISLGPRELLIVEGIHALHPGLFESDHVFRVFIQPMTSLAFDPVSRLNTSDLRLLRRIVRDRRQRGTTAADNIMRWPSVRRGEQRNLFPHVDEADAIFDTSLIYEMSVLKVYAERYLLEIPDEHPAAATAFRLRQLIDRFVAIHPDHVPPTSILREFIGGALE